MKIPLLLRRKKLRAATARRSAGAAEIDYAEIPEPNMKLSRALLIVLLLHVVAVSGIIAFNAIKTRQSVFVPARPANLGNNSVATPPVPVMSAKPVSPRPPIAQRESAPRDEPKTSHSPSKNDQGKSTERRKVSLPSGKVYTVVKGDNPVSIAKKLKVSYDDLIALNHIEDPRKLKIGQKLLIPKTTKPKKAHE